MDSKTLSGYAAEYGTFVGAAWCIDFLLIMWGFTGQGALLMLLALLLFVLLPVFPCYFARRMRRHVPANVGIGYGRAFMFCVLMMMYTCLLTAAVEYVYLRFVDQGQMLDTLTAIISSPQSQTLYRQVGMEATLQQTENALAALSAMRVSDIVVTLMNQNIFISLLTAMLAACFCTKTATPLPPTDNN